ncbi:23S rRNA (adenine(2503)-C(2))-methyltransferase RlmN, partial [Pseudomonas aeruginosa]
KYPMGMLLDTCRRYIYRLGAKRVLTVEYTLLKDVNYQPEHAKQMIALMKDTPCKINLFPFTPFPHSGYERPSNNAIPRLQDMV